MKIKTIHQVLEFEQDTWLKPHIDFNSKKRQEARTKFEKNFYKIMNNSVFGNFLQPEHKFLNIALVNSEKKINKIVSKPTFESCKIFDDNLVAPHCKTASVSITKPLYVGQTILDGDIQFFYSFLKKGTVQNVNC